MIKEKLGDYRNELQEIISQTSDPMLEKYIEKNANAEYYLGYYKALAVNAASVDAYILRILTSKGDLRSILLSYVENLRYQKNSNPVTKNTSIKGFEDDLFTKGYKEGLNYFYSEAINILVNIATSS